MGRRDADNLHQFFGSGSASKRCGSGCLHHDRRSEPSTKSCTTNLILSRTNNDLINLLSSVQMAIVMLGPDLRICRFTPMAERMMNLIPANVGRPIKDLNMQIDIDDLARLLEEVPDDAGGQPGR
jgi:hypothetical protein